MLSRALATSRTSLLRSLHTQAPPRLAASRRLHTPSPARLSLPLRAMQTSTAPLAPKEKKDEAVQKTDNRFRLSPVDAKILQTMLDDLGVSTPSQLRSLITKKSLPVLGLVLLDTVRLGGDAWRRAGGRIASPP